MRRDNGTETELLEARLGDAAARCEKGIVAQLPFLTPREQKVAERWFRTSGDWNRAWFWGGYPTAERATLFLLPDYLLPLLSDVPQASDAREVLALLEADVAEAVCAVEIVGSGYRDLTHRDFLGAVLGLGLERDAIGDLAVQDPHRAVVFCSRTVAVFLKDALTQVGSDRVRCTDYIVTEAFTDGKQYRPIRETVASARLDCVVAALCHLSREEAQSAVQNGSVDVDFEEEDRTDRVLEAPVTLSIRGHGRFVLRAFEGETRKGRLRLRADQLI